MVWIWVCRYREEASDWKDTGVVCESGSKRGFPTAKQSEEAARKHKHHGYVRSL